jgi:hypothetical protein
MAEIVSKIDERKKLTNFSCFIFPTIKNNQEKKLKFTTLFFSRKFSKKNQEKK